jgi:phage shock protein PspC (stress-responsive transcriptional regulator)
VGRTERLLRRSRRHGGMWLGLCAGIGAHLGLDPVFVRFALLALALLSAGGLAIVLLYVIFGLMVPLEDESKGKG